MQYVFHFITFVQRRARQFTDIVITQVRTKVWHWKAITNTCKSVYIIVNNNEMYNLLRGPTSQDNFFWKNGPKQWIVSGCGKNKSIPYYQDDDYYCNFHSHISITSFLPFKTVSWTALLLPRCNDKPIMTIEPKVWKRKQKERKKIAFRLCILNFDSSFWVQTTGKIQDAFCVQAHFLSVK